MRLSNSNLSFGTQQKNTELESEHGKTDIYFKDLVKWERRIKQSKRME